MTALFLVKRHSTSNRYLIGFSAFGRRLTVPFNCIKPLCKVLAGCRWFWKVLGGFSCLWVVLTGFGWFWIILPGFEWLWMVMAGFEWLWVVLAG